MLTERNKAIIESYRIKQSLRLVAQEFGVMKGSIQRVVKKHAPNLMREPAKTFKFERPKTRNRKRKFQERINLLTLE